MLFRNGTAVFTDERRAPQFEVDLDKPYDALTSVADNWETGRIVVGFSHG
jgi:hypothetical protein